jgi:tetratricopeptide (TPR) repeat protein
MESRYTFGDERISHGSWSYLNYVYPAARLALLAVGQRYGLTDPAARLLEERREVNRLVVSYSGLFDPPAEDEGGEDDSRRRALEDAETVFREQLGRTPRDEMLWSRYGGILLRLGRFDEAEDALQRSMALPSCGDERRAGDLYDFACVKAMRGMEDECRAALEESARIRPLNREHTITDPDLESVRDTDWFGELVNAGQD